MNTNKSVCPLPSKAIPIPIKAPSIEKYSDTDDNNKSEYISKNDEYGLKLHIFDPNKFSPPSSWNTRLLSRFDNYF